MNIRPDNKQTAISNFKYPAADKTALSAGKQSKPQTLNADSFQLSSDDELKRIMEQTGASRVTETVRAKTVYLSAQSSSKAVSSVNGDVSSYEKYSNCALCYTYLERTLTLEGDKIEGGIMTITGSSESASFSLESLKKGSMTLSGDSLTDDMRERIRELLSQDNFSDMNALSDRWNKCAGMLSDVFGTDMSDFMLDTKGYESLFGKLDANEDNYINKSLERLEMLRDYMNKLRERMEEILKGVRENDPFGGMKAFGSMYFKLEMYSYTEIASYTDKAIAGDKVEVPERTEKAAEYVKYESYSYIEETTSVERILSAAGAGESSVPAEKPAE